MFKWLPSDLIYHLPIRMGISQPRQWGVALWLLQVQFCLVHALCPVGCVVCGAGPGAELADLRVSAGSVTCPLVLPILISPEGKSRNSLAQFTLKS